MSAALRLAINSLSGRPRRSLLLAGAVALSAALIVCVACAMASVQGALNHQIAATIGAADVSIRPAGSGKLMPDTVLDRVRGWPEVAGAVGRLQATLALSIRKDAYFPSPGGGFQRQQRRFASTALGNSTTSLVVPTVNAATARRSGDLRAAATLVPPPDLIAGRLPAPQAEDEIVIDALLAYRLSFEYASQPTHLDGAVPVPVPPRPALRQPSPPPGPARVETAGDAERLNQQARVHLGDTVEVVRQLFASVERPILLPSLRPPTRLKVVGIAGQPPLGGRAQAYMTLTALAKVANQRGLSQIDIALRPGQSPDAFVAAHRAELPPSLILETTQKVTSGLDKNMKSSQLGMILATVMAFLSASFIILTGLTTSVTERQRELGVLRCVGAGRGQLARMQLTIGALLGGLGALVGVPAGLLLAWGLTSALRDQLPTGLAVSSLGIALAIAGSLISGTLGAAWPAWRTARLSPLAALASRAAPPRVRGVQLITLLALACLLIQLAIVGFPRDGQVVFWGYATVGLPLMFMGYFLLGVPAILLVVRLSGPALRRLLGLPPRLLERTVQSTPYRHGLTAGALMAGLALMVAIWTNGGAILRDWLHKIDFPDAFVSGLNLPEEAQDQLRRMTSIVADTAAVTLHPVETDIFGVRALQKYKTTFVGFDPEPFFRMTRMQWVQGDPVTALARLKQGGAVIVAREFLTAQGLGVGKTFTARQEDREHTFEIVGVVSSPGLEVASKFFNVGEDYTDQALHAVFGSRSDMKDRFFGGEPAPIQLITISLTDQARRDDAAALEAIRERMLPYGILDAGSGRQIKEQITFFATGALVAVSVIAMVAMLVACFGVANLIIAGIESRQFEFGILRAVGARRGLLTRLILGEALLIALTACILGTLMGTQGSWAGQRLYRLLLGLDLRLRPPAGPIAIGWLIVIALTLAAAWPAVWRLGKKQPRDLLAATKG
jgi:putative ABC transport system permease protein